MPNRYKLQSLLAVSVTVPVYINIENLKKWRADLQNKTPNFIKFSKKRSLCDFEGARKTTVPETGAVIDSNGGGYLQDAASRAGQLVNADVNESYSEATNESTGPLLGSKNCNHTFSPQNTNRSSNHKH